MPATFTPNGVPAVIPVGGGPLMAAGVTEVSPGIGEHTEEHITITFNTASFAPADPHRVNQSQFFTPYMGKQARRVDCDCEGTQYFEMHETQLHSQTGLTTSRNKYA